MRNLPKLSFCLLAMGALFASAEARQIKLVRAPGAPDVHNFQRDATPMDKSAIMRVSLSLSGVKRAAADAFIQSQYDPASRDFHRWISTQEFGKRFGASESDVKVVSDFLTSNGFSDLRISASRTFISAKATFSVAERAFHTTLAHYVRPANLKHRSDPPTFFGPQTPVMLPAAVASRTDGVFGLCNLALAHPNYQARPAQGNVSYLPAQIATAYRTTVLQNAGYLGQGQKIAVFSPTVRDPLDPYIFFQNLGITPQFTIYDVGIDGGPSQTDTGGAGEAALDIEVMIGQAPKVTILMMSPYIGQTDQEYMSGTLDGYDAVGVIGGIPVLSSSWDLEEAGVIAEGSTSYATAFQNLCAALAASGVSIFNSSGDAAAFSNSGSGAVTTKLETSCPYLTSVGGTNLALYSNNTYYAETLWAFSGTTQKPEGGGGGISRLFKRPTWQIGPGTTNPYSNGYREVPDVSANADPASGYEIISQEQDAVIGGTSASTPLWAINTLMMEEVYAYLLKTKQVYLGLLNPAYYQLGTWFENPAQDYAGVPYVYHDTKTGNNGKYPTTISYDLCSGWGSADFYKMYLDLGYYEHISPFSPDYQPYKPTTAVSGLTGTWTSPIMIHLGTTAVTEPASFSHLVKYNFSTAIANLGNCDGPLNLVTLSIDGKVVYSVNNLALPYGYRSVYNLMYSYQFPAGKHTVSLAVNSGAKVRELNLVNNVYTRSINVL